MMNALKSLGAVVRALFLGVIGQPDGGTEPEAKARKVRQRQRMEDRPPSGALQTLGTLVRTAFYAAILQPDNETDSRKDKRKPRK